MLLSEIPRNPPAAVGIPILASQNECDCHDCHQEAEVTPPSHLLLHPTLTLDNWEVLCPTDSGKAVEATVHWCPKDKATKVAAEEAANEMLSKLAPTGVDTTEFIQALTAYLVQYADLIAEQLGDPAKLKATLVASRGRQGTKCPLWHVDNVPIRWIQALEGPGCELVTNADGVNWEAWKDNNNNQKKLRKRFDSVEATNQYRVPSAAGAGVYKAKTQEVALLRGGRWNDCRKIDYPESLPVVHRSPVFIPPYQARLLLKQDVAFNYD